MRVLGQSMRVFVRSNKAGSPDRPLSLSSQTFCEGEDVLKLMEKHVATSGLVHTLYIEFESMQVPICHEGELRVVAQLAAAYNNAIIEQNVRCQKDLYGESYERGARVFESASAGKFGKDLTRSQTDPSPLSPPLATEKSRAEGEWDEELHGEQIVYDEFYEQNADISTWFDFKTTRARKFGEFEH